MKKMPAFGYGAVSMAMWALTAMASPIAHATDVTTYGAGLNTCKAYSEAREASSPEQVAFIDWLSGYFSGVDNASSHRNNFLGLADLNTAMASLDVYCGARPLAPFAAAAWTLIIGAKTGPTAHSAQVTTFGSADKSCQAYRDAREQREVEYWREFTDWLGGYLSGVNAISLDTTNVLGKMQLPEAVNWLDEYCSAHPLTSFGSAVAGLVSNAPVVELAQSKPAPSLTRSSSASGGGGSLP